MKGLIFNIQRFSIHDGPGIRTVIFFKGCPLNCPWCCNPESKNRFPEIGYSINKCIRCRECVNSCPKKAIKFVKDKFSLIRKKCNNCGLCVDSCYAGALRLFGKYMTIEEIIEIVLKDKTFYEFSCGGVTISGGEPTHQMDYLKKLLIRLKKEHINIAIETSGYFIFDKFIDVIKYLDYILYDLKIFDDRKHKSMIGKSNKIILDNLVRLNEFNKRIIIRVPIIPNYTNDNSNLIKIIRFIKNLSNVREIHFLPYHRLGEHKYKQLDKKYNLERISPIKIFRLEDNIKKILEKSNISYKIGG